MSRPAELISLLQLQPHPEGGWYREVYRGAATVVPEDGRPPRSALTVIYFLLERGQFSAWHVVASDECWQYCEGAPLELLMFDPRNSHRARIELGPIAASRQSVSVVPPNVWQAARSLGDYTLIQCAVGPGFDFADFQMIRNFPDRDGTSRRLDDWTAYL